MDSSSVSIEKHRQSDTGLAGLLIIASQHYQIPVNEESIKHKFTPAVTEIGRPSFFGNQEIILAAKSLKLKAKAVHLLQTDIDNDIMPALCKSTMGEYFILTGTPMQEAPSAVAIDAQAELAQESTPLYVIQFISALMIKKLTWDELSQFWQGEAILFAQRKSLIRGKIRKFNIGWFIPAIVKYKSLFFQVLISSFIIQLLGLGAPLFFQIVMDKVLIHNATSTLYVLAIGFGFLIIFETVLTVVRNYLFSHTTTRVDVELGAQLFGHLINLPFAWFQDRQAGQSVARIRELDSLRNFITSTALTLVIDLGFTFIYLVVMLFYSRTLTLIVFCSLPFYILLSLFITPILKRRLDRKFRYGADNQSFLVEAITGIETIKSLALEPQMKRRWENFLAKYVTSAFRAQNFGQMASQMASLIQKVTTGLIIIFGSFQVMDNLLTVGQLVAFNMIAGRISGPILKLTQLWQDFQQAGISLKRLGDILNTPCEQGTETNLSNLPKLEGHIKFEHVSFRYLPNSQLVIDDLSFEVWPGEIVGLVGASGSGKSTLAKLILKMYPLEKGQIFLDDANLSILNADWLRSKIGIVLQENCLINGTIRENIAIRNPGLPFEEVQRVAILAGAHEFIMSLPNGYDTQVGERGGNLSGGQKQRIAIARVLIDNPGILIFDEATSALDYISESIIHQNMGKICYNRTVIIIAHRLSSIKNAHRIIVLDKGRVIENGPPKKLMEKKEAFFRMVEAQRKLTDPPE
jgi:subfamily B ATP-binding cassette protein HlyB/CyaB